MLVFWARLLLYFIVLHSHSLATKPFFLSFYWSNVHKIKIFINTQCFHDSHSNMSFLVTDIAYLLLLLFALTLFFHFSYQIIRYFLSQCFIHSISISAESTSHFGYLVILYRHFPPSILILLKIYELFSCFSLGNHLFLSLIKPLHYFLKLFHNTEYNCTFAIFISITVKEPHQFFITSDTQHRTWSWMNSNQYLKIY